MKRGDIYYADLNPTLGSEIKKKRPVLIVSNDANNRVSSTITVVPITSNVKKVFPFEVLLEPKKTNLMKQSKAQCHQVRTISKLQLKSKLVGCVDEILITKVNVALKLHLGLF